MGEVKLNRMFENKIMPNFDEHCVYRLIHNGNVIYVGQTENLKTRVCQHIDLGREFNSFEFTTCKKNDANNIEAKLIVELSPILNKTLPKNDLFISLGNLRKDIKEAFLSSTEMLPVVFTTFGRKYISKIHYDKSIGMVEEVSKKIFKLGDE